MELCSVLCWRTGSGHSKSVSRAGVGLQLKQPGEATRHGWHCLQTDGGPRRGQRMVAWAFACAVMTACYEGGSWGMGVGNR